MFLFKNKTYKQGSRKWFILFTSLSVLAFSLLLISSVYSAVSLNITSPPDPISSALPTTQATATADEGHTITAASFQIYKSNLYPTGVWQDCTSDTGTAFGSNRTVNFSCTVASLSSGSYKMNIRASSSDGSTKSIETSAFIVDREVPAIDFNPLPGDPLLIENNRPVFTGTATDTLTDIVSVEYKHTLATSNSPVPSDFANEGWTPCTINGSGTSVDFTCDPNHIFADSSKGAEYRMHVRATDSVGNLSGTSNYYKFQVDTTPPYNLAITQPNESGITLNGNSVYEIKWVPPLDAFELGSGPIKIEYSRTGNFTYSNVTVVDNHTGSGPYAWTVPNNYDTDAAKIRITATDLAGNSVSVVSANPFTIVRDTSPEVSITPITGHLTNSKPRDFQASAYDPKGIISARYWISGGASGGCVAQDGSFGGTTEALVCSGVSYSEGVNTLYVEATNAVNKTGQRAYTFRYDSIPPTVNAGSLGTINQPTKPGASASDTGSGIASYSWSKISGPGSITFGGGSSTLNPSISASVDGLYSAQLKVCDLAGNCASDTVSFTWTNNPMSFSVISPSGGERLKGGSNLLVSWTDPEGVANYTFDLSYSLNGGGTWIPITHPTLNKGTHSYTWTVPTQSTENARVRVQVKVDGSVVLSEQSAIFTIDATAPVVNAGEITGIISTPSAPGASASDNFDTPSQLSYSWSSTAGPAPVIFGGGVNILNPTLSGTKTGVYTARLTVTDRVGNSASDTVDFNFNGNPADFSVLEPSSIYYQGGEELSIIWTAASGAKRYKIEYSQDSGNSYEIIANNITGTSVPSGLSHNWTPPQINNNQLIVRVTAYDEHDNSTDALSDTFSIDSLPPVINLSDLGNIFIPTQPTVSANDGIGSGIDSYNWSQVSGPGTINFSETSSIDPFISSTQSGSYVARITVTDKLGMSSYKDLSFYYNIEPPKPVITSPGSDQFWPGLSTRNIRWEMKDTNNLTNFTISYSLNNGDSWEEIATVDSTARLLPWNVPEENTTNARIKVLVRNSAGYSAEAERSFNIDSMAPVINIGSIGNTGVATQSGTSVTDNIDSEDDMRFIWKGVGAPEGGTLVFSPQHNIMDPKMAGTVTGNYTAQITAQDRAGHISSQEMTFYWEGDPSIPIVSSPDSTVFISGGNTQEIVWHIDENPDLTNFIISYSLDGGITWENIDTVSPATRSYTWNIPEGINSDSAYGSLIRVRAVDTYNNYSDGHSPSFTIDSLSPVISMGTITSPISEPTRADFVGASDNIDSESELSFTWSGLSLPYPEAALIIDEPQATSTYFSADMTGEYEALLTVSDRAGNTATSSLAFVWDSLHDPVLISPATGDFIAGGKPTNLVWQLDDPGNLARIEAQYSSDAGVTWLDIDSNIASSSLEFTWQVPDNINSTSSLARIMTVNTLNKKATSTSGLFTIDSTPPVVDAGSFADNVNSATPPGASASDNFDKASELRYSWSQSHAPNRGKITFTGGSDILNPSISGNINGDYTALLTVYDRAGNSGSDTVSFTRRISSGGGGGSSSPACTEVVYGDWGECYNGLQYRSIISSTPSVCTPTAEQRAGQEQSCSEANNPFCQSVEFGAWGECINGLQQREIISYYPIPCDLTSEQRSQSQRSCELPAGPSDGGPFDDDAFEVMDSARKNYVGTDANILKNVTGQILIQVEDHGRAWYVSAVDKSRYYLGSPTNAFSVMSLIGLGIKNERLFKIPVGLLEGSLTEDIDSDGDGLSDRLEEALLTDKHNPDTDGDGYDDKTEILNGYDPNGPGKMPFDASVLRASLGHIFIQVETNGEAWYVEPRVKKRYYLGRPNEALAIMREFGLGITNEDLNKIPVGQFTESQLARITRMLEDRKREIEERARQK